MTFMDIKQPLKSRNIFGIILVLLGGMFLVGNLLPDWMDFGSIAWDLVLIIAGIVLLVNAKKRLLGPALIIIGTLGLIPGDSSKLIFPTLVIFFGIHLLTRNKTRRREKDETEAADNNDKGYFSHFTEERNLDKIEDLSLFGGGEKVFHSAAFQGGTITAIFGGSKLDLTDCKLKEGDQYLDVTIIFGGMTLIIPDSWKIQIDVVPLFGGFSTKQARTNVQIIDSTAVLHIRGIVIFGGGEIKLR
jgi:predicted membrane protein